MLPNQKIKAVYHQNYQTKRYYLLVTKQYKQTDSGQTNIKTGLLVPSSTSDFSRSRVRCCLAAVPGDLGGGGGCCGGSRVRPVGVVRQEASVEKADDRRVALAYPPPSKNTISHPKLDNFQGHKITRTVDMGRTFFTKVKHSLELHAFSKCSPPFFANFCRLSHNFLPLLTIFYRDFFLFVMIGLECREIQIRLSGRIRLFSSFKNGSVAAVKKYANCKIATILVHCKRFHSQ